MRESHAKCVILGRSAAGMIAPCAWGADLLQLFPIHLDIDFPLMPGSRSQRPCFPPYSCPHHRTVPCLWVLLSGARQRCFFRKIRDYYGSGWVGPGLTRFFVVVGKSSQNSPKPVVIFWSSIPCMCRPYSVCT